MHADGNPCATVDAVVPAVPEQLQGGVGLVRRMAVCPAVFAGLERSFAPAMENVDTDTLPPALAARPPDRLRELHTLSIGYAVDDDLVWVPGLLGLPSAPDAIFSPGAAVNI